MKMYFFLFFPLKKVGKKFFQYMKMYFLLIWWDNFFVILVYYN